MVTKGIIKSIDLLGNTCTVHMPFFETAGNDPIIETATVSNTPGSYNGYKVGDVVYVAFEDGSMSNPVVIGKLYLGTEKEKADPRGVSNVEESTAAKKATLPADSKLTAEIDSNVPNTTVPYSSLSSIANGLNKLNTEVAQNDRDYGNRFKQVISNAEGLKSELEQTARNMVAKVSGYKQEVDANGKLVYDENGQPKWELDKDGERIPQEFGWNLQADSWSVFNENKNILTANANGLKVTGTIEATDGDIGKFIIGKVHNRTDDEGNEVTDESGNPIPESGIYTENYIDCFKQTPGESDNLEGEKTGSKGVYIGTDGIKLGDKFSVDPEGNMTATSITITYKDGDTEKTAENIDAAVAQILAISKEYSDQAEAQANGYADGQAKKARDEVYTKLDIKDTKVTVNGVETSVVLADKLWVNSANINGQLTADKINTTGLQADKIEVKKTTGEIIFKADGVTDPTKPDVQIGGFKVTDFELKSENEGTDGGRDGQIYLTPKGSQAVINETDHSNWGLTVGDTFGVNLYGKMYAKGAFVSGRIEAEQGTIGNLRITGNLTGAGLTVSQSSILLENDESSLTLRANANMSRPELTFSKNGALLGPGGDCGFIFKGGTSYTEVTYELGLSVANSDTQNKSTATVTAYTDEAHTQLAIVPEDRTVYIQVSGTDKKIWPVPDVDIFDKKAVTIKAGTSSSTVNLAGEFNEVTESGFITERSYNQATKATTVSSGASCTFKTYSANKLYSVGSIIPEVGGNGDLGSTANYWDGGYFDKLYSTSGEAGTRSDIKAKNSINYDISKYDSIFDNLKPVSYKYNSGTSGRTHLGFIAQDIQEAISAANLTDKDCSIVVIDGEGFDKTEGKVIDEAKAYYYIRPGQLHALEVRQIQLLKAQVKQQAEEIAELKQMVKDLTTK